MLERFLENYIDELYSKQNMRALPEQQGLFSKQDYYQLLRPVIEVVSQYKDYSIQELRNKLYEISGLEEKVKHFVKDRQMTPGMVFSYGTDNYKEIVVIGNRQEFVLNDQGILVPDVEPMERDTIIELNSEGKPFIAVSLSMLATQGIINLDDRITKYAPQFKNLKDVSIFDLLTFRVPLKTKARVDAAKSREEAEQILFDIEVDISNDNTRPYTDMGAMVLKYVIESASGMSYYDFLNKYIFKKIGMNETYVTVPKTKLDRVASNNFSGKYLASGEFVFTTSNPKGIAYDPKARIMGQPEGNLSGHAGLFSTTDDMVTFSKALIDGRLISQEEVFNMGKNQTGRLLGVNDKGEKIYVQYLGALCYSKNPILANSEVYHPLSGATFASGGFTGTQLTIDPINRLFFSLMSNKVHNRLISIDKSQQQNVQVDEKGMRFITLPNGEIKVDSTRFAWDRDALVVHPAINLAIQYQMLDKLLGYDKETNKSEENVRYI